jgi:hypothetical protein
MAREGTAQHPRRTAWDQACEGIQASPPADSTTARSVSTVWSKRPQPFWPAGSLHRRHAHRPRGRLAPLEQGAALHRRWAWGEARVLT